MPRPRRRAAIPHSLSALVLLAFALPAFGQTPPCTQVTTGTATIAVDRDGNASPDCLEIPKNKVDVNWTATEGVTQLLVSFDLVDNKKPLDDPTCSGTTCSFEKLKANKTGDFKYSVTVTRGDGSSATVDPKLIIQN